MQVMIKLSGSFRNKSMFTDLKRKLDDYTKICLLDTIDVKLLMMRSLII